MWVCEKCGFPAVTMAAVETHTCDEIVTELLVSEFIVDLELINEGLIRATRLADPNFN